MAAAAYVLRPTGWVKLVDRRRRGGPAGGRRAGRRGEPGASWSGCARSWPRPAASTQAETERLRAELDAARKEAESLHRKLRGALSDVKRGEAALRKLQGEMEAVRAEGQAQVSAAESETRRLKARLGEAEAALEASRRAAREGRSVEDMRRTAAAGHGAGRGPGAAARTGAAAACPCGPRRPWTRSSRDG